MIEFAPSMRLPDRDTAWLYAITLTHDNKYDWRMPAMVVYDTDHTVIITPVRDTDEAT
jgi:hypothetical protein